MNTKILALTFVLVMVISAFTACGKQREDAETTAATTETLLPGVVENIFEKEEDDDNSVTEETEAGENQAEIESEKETLSEEPLQDDTEQEESKPKETTPKETAPKETVPKQPEGITDYEVYKAMSPDEQVAFYESFGSAEAFMEWFNNAKAEYDAQQTIVEIGEGGAVVEIVE